MILQPAIIIYALAVAPLMLSTPAKIVEGVRPISQLGDKEFEAQIDRACRLRPRSEWIAIGVGAVIGIVVTITGDVLAQPTALRLYILFEAVVEFSIMAWWIFVAIANSRVVTTLCRQPLKIDIFDLKPFEPVGRQSLILALICVGGMTVGLIFGYTRETIFSWQFLSTYIIIIVFTVLLFFLNMWRVHTLLAHVKQDELSAAESKLVGAYRRLQRAADADPARLAAEMDAWSVAKRELKRTKTWPYNTEMLQTLFISTLMPLAVIVSKLLAAVIASGRV